MNDRDACIALNMISGIGYVRYNALAEYFGSPGQAAGKSRSEYACVPGITGSVAENLAAADWQAMCDSEKELASRAGVRILTLYDEGYPQPLNSLYDPPLCLYVRGKVPAGSDNTLAVVGSRRMSRYGEEMTRVITADAVAAGFVIVSGLAYGVDTVAHRTAVECGGVTVAVLGGGLLRIHPAENIPLAQNMIKQGGALVTEFPMNFPVSRSSFPRRNRLIAALSEGMLVVEAGIKSGAILSAKAAADLSKEVFAVPGQATNEQARGCHQLIRDGAHLTENFDDIRTVLHPVFQPDLLPETGQPARRSLSDLEPVEQEVFRAVCSTGISLEDLAAAVQMEMGELIAVLMRLEFKFFIKRGADMLYYPAE